MFYMMKKKLGLKYQENSAPFRFVRSNKKLKGQEKIAFLLIKVNRSDSQDNFLPLSLYRTVKIKSNYERNSCNKHTELIGKHRK